MTIRREFGIDKSCRAGEAIYRSLMRYAVIFETTIVDDHGLLT